MAKRKKIDFLSLSSSQKHEFEMNEFFSPKKMNSRKVAMSFLRSGDKKTFKKIAECGSALRFGHFSDDTNRLLHANFCKNRMCPMCSWRRSLKNFSHLSDVFSVLESTHEFVFLTLTERNCTADQLSERMTAICKNFRNWLRRDSLAVFDGCFRSLEVTYNAVDDTYHPHLHIILCCPQGSYFGTDKYMAFDKWLSEWRSVGGYDYNPSIRVNRIGEKTIYNPKSKRYVTISLKKALKECSKYTIKDSDFLKSDVALDKQDEVIQTLYNAMDKRRLIEYYGVMKDLHKHFTDLKKSDDNDLINVSDDVANGAELEYIFVYQWQWNPKKKHFEYICVSNQKPQSDPPPNSI